MKKLSVYTLLLIATVVSLVPFYWMFINATHQSGEIFSVPPNFLPGDSLVDNYTNLQGNINISGVMMNSLIITVIYTVLSVLFCSMAGYAFAKFRFRGRDQIFFLLLLAIMIPSQVTLIPLFQMMVKLQWLNTYQAVILPTLANPFGIYLMRQNMKAIPDELLEAARVDGCGEWRIFFTMILPVMRPALAALAIFMFMSQWNNFVWPLLVMSDKSMYTLPVALSTLVGFTRIDYGQVMLGTTISTLPIMAFFLLLQRQFISGLLGGSVKG
ncbi:carbohydrate ABC transporter permease [Brevibacillus fluminis]|uniref:Carbohydrate ABC transporter permease n=1 Tax=Brevibacillus fluminis TaxID=511487 RepID=A0A3M8DGG2_9BACL|nr:carbohydrate ABC transporter permease [Brevibacillus fluminis]RNB87173.1 carbohydrate ABC transporter permease [Brevibacillus fluminis]